MHHLDGAWVDILGWAFVLTGLLVFTGLVVLFNRRGASRSRDPAMPPRLDRRREWDSVVSRAAKELARGPRVEALQADAAVTIESAEYAYNRLVVDCAKHCSVSVAPTFEPARELPRKPDEAPAEERAPLAA